MPKSTDGARTGKPAKPHPDFPLFPHATRRWAKKVRGRLHYFGPWNDPDGALALWLQQKDDLLAGRRPRVSRDTLSIRDLANAFLTSRQRKMEAGDLSPRHFRDLHAACARIIAVLGKDRAVEDLGPDDFATLRRNIQRNRGPWATSTEIARTRAVFNFAFNKRQQLISKPVLFGEEFDKPSKRALRLARNRQAHELSAADCRRLLDAARGPIKAAILLGLNCGLGNTDVARVRKRNIEFKRGWLNFPRGKTGIDRTCPLWPETIVELQRVAASRPSPRNEADEDLIFVTKYGHAWNRTRQEGGKIVPVDAVGQEFTKLLRTQGLHVRGRGFYSLRHLFRTVADGCLDQVAIDHIMGHERGGMADLYRTRIEPTRLQAVVDYVHAWLWPKKRAAV